MLCVVSTSREEAIRVTITVRRPSTLLQQQRGAYLALPQRDARQGVDRTPIGAACFRSRSGSSISSNGTQQQQQLQQQLLTAIADEVACACVRPGALMATHRVAPRRRRERRRRRRRRRVGGRAGGRAGGWGGGCVQPVARTLTIGRSSAACCRRCHRPHVLRKRDGRTDGRPDDTVAI